MDSVAPLARHKGWSASILACSILVFHSPIPCQESCTDKICGKLYSSRPKNGFCTRKTSDIKYLSSSSTTYSISEQPSVSHTCMPRVLGQRGTRNAEGSCLPAPRRALCDRSSSVIFGWCSRSTVRRHPTSQHMVHIPRRSFARSTINHQPTRILALK
jgi:hypothetical protein